MVVDSQEGTNMGCIPATRFLLTCHYSDVLSGAKDQGAVLLLFVPYKRVYVLYRQPLLWTACFLKVPRSGLAG
jgi:hypothetical protein